MKSVAKKRGRPAKTEIVKAIPVDAPISVDLNPQALIAEAVKNKLPVEQLERLLDLAERWKARRAKEAYFESLARFQALCPTIKKTREVHDKYGKLRYRYAPLDSIESQVKDLLRNEGFSYTFDTKPTEGKLTIWCYSHHREGHTEATMIEMEIDKDAFMNDNQKTGAATTYGKRYSFCNAFGIMTGDEDTDANVQSDDGDGQQETSRQQATPLRQAESPRPDPEKAKLLESMKNLLDYSLIDGILTADEVSEAKAKWNKTKTIEDARTVYNEYKKLMDERYLERDAKGSKEGGKS